ncbi:LANO_0G06348g1_1 [Lachancea nothofagi CBS 11611]|uniref:LANO_0G06348g1_1 n=1 Tax=Lachancea nothofagi CBS 11611 TaxID=1266666 RepID=A0A1G4KGX7_9SACH|nr:LANO_0G06348g1_1 [Lachancea nothofagi CBS 11611]
MMSPEELESFNKNGFLVIPNFLSKSKCEELLTRSHKYLGDFDLTNHPLTQFTTSDKGDLGDEYFLNSSDNVSFFFEPSAFADIDGQKQLIKPKEKAVNKFGHGLHLCDPDFAEITTESRRVREIAKSLGFHKPRALQSMVLCKQPEIGGAVPSHQDSVFLYTDPESAIGFWIPLEDATIENGCLSFSPGSHLTHPITKRFVRRFDKDSGDALNGTEFQYFENGEEIEKNLSRDENVAWKSVECKAGQLVLIHGSVLHKSGTNTSNKSRFAYAFHLIEDEANYDELNWLQSKVKSIL